MHTDNIPHNFISSFVGVCVLARHFGGLVCPFIYLLPMHKSTDDKVQNKASNRVQNKEQIKHKRKSKVKSKECAKYNDKGKYTNENKRTHIVHLLFADFSLFWGVLFSCVLPDLSHLSLSKGKESNNSLEQALN